MTTHYRFVHLVPDPFTGTRFPLGALVSNGRVVTSARAGYLPDESCIGASAGLARSLRDLLSTVETFDRLPTGFGPYVYLDEPRLAPAIELSGVLAWLEALMERRVDDPASSTLGRRPKRSVLGRRFFETWRVSHWVADRFDPATSWDGWLAEEATGLEATTHWTGGKARLLLMEPVVPDRPSFEEDLKAIATRASAYEFHLQKMANGKTGSFVTYILRGGPEAARKHAIEVLQTKSKVIDVSVDGQRKHFLSDIREIGQTAELLSPAH